MAIDERLLLTLEARVAKYEKDLARARRRTDQHGAAMQARMLRTSTAITASFASIAAPLAGAMSLRGATALIDASVRIDNALKVAGLSGEALEKVYNQLYAAAQANAAPIETLVGLYSKLALVQNELGVSQEELVGFSSNVALALRVAGTDAKAASGALLQLSQALGAGTVRAEEFNSVLEGAPTIAQAVAAGLQEAGGSVAKLRQLVVNGEVSSRAFFRAFEAGAPMLQEKVADAVMTIDQRMTNLGNSLLDAARRFNTSTEAANTFGTAIDQVAGFVNGIDFDGLISQLRQVAAAFEAGAQWAQNFGRSVGEASGLDNIGKFLTGGSVQKSFMGGALTVMSTKALEERLNAAFSDQIEKAGELTEQAILQSVLGQGGGATAKGDRLKPTTFTPVSIVDFPADPSGSKGKGSRGSKETSDFARQIADAQRRAELLRQETALLAGVNPALDQYGAKAEAASLKAQLLTAAQAEGVTLTPDVLANIDRVADAYGNAAGEAAKLAEAQDRVKETAEEIANLAGSVVGGFAADLRAGKSASEALANALNKVVDKLIDVAIQALIVGPLLKALGGGGGWLSWLGLSKGGEVQKMASGGRVRGPGTGTSDSIPTMLSDGEHVINARSAAKWRPMLEAINADRVPGFAAGGAVGGGISRLGTGGGASINFAPTINVQAAQGGDARQNADLARQTAAQVEASLKGLVAREIATQLRPGNLLAR